MPQAPLSNQWVSLFGNFFFGGFLCIWCCWLVVVRCKAWICGDRRGGGLSLWIGVVEGVGLWWSASMVEFWWWHRSEFGSVGDGLHDCSVAGSVMVGGWIEVWWWVLVAEIGVWWWVLVMAQIEVWWWDFFTDWSLVMGFVLRSKRKGA